MNLFVIGMALPQPRQQFNNLGSGDRPLGHAQVEPSL
jgi:hypothetical protein